MQREKGPTLGYPWYPKVVVAGVETGDVDGREGRVGEVWLCLGSGGEPGPLSTLLSLLPPRQPTARTSGGRALAGSHSQKLF